jgi:hypothetical protein
MYCPNTILIWLFVINYTTTSVSVQECFSWSALDIRSSIVKYETQCVVSRRITSWTS